MASMSTNPLKERLQAGHPTVGTWCEIPDPFVAEILAGAGYDLICVDWQHGLHHFESIVSVVHAIAGAGAVPIVRVPANDEWLIQKALDAGAFGVIVPMVSSAEEAARASASCRFPPRGIRSYGPIRAAPAITDDPAIVNEQILCIPMIETASGVESIDAIVAVPGVDAVIVGPYDLSLSMQLPLGSSDVKPLIDKVLAAGRSAGVPVGRHVDAPDAAAAGFAEGFSFLTIGTDRELLASTAVAEAARARPAAAAARPGREQTAARAVATAAEE